MAIYKIIALSGPEANNTGYFVPRLYKLHFSKGELWNFISGKGLHFVKERLKGWTIWYVRNEKDYAGVKEAINELKKTRIFDFRVLVSD